MATQSILRNGLVSPTFATTLQRSSASSTRSILKRPGALPLSPAFSYTASFSFQHSSSPSFGSPHVKFLPSPALVATFTAHSARSYDRAPISVSPLERTYITSLENFKLSAPPKPFRSITSAQNSPAITDFEDPRSPKVHNPAPKQNLLRFAALTNNETATRNSKSLASSLASYPRSPYPSAPLVSSEEVNNDVFSPTQLVRASSLDLPRRNKKGLTLGSTSSLIPVVVTPALSSLGRSVFSPSINEGGKAPAPLDLESRLSEAFWKAVSLEERNDVVDDEVMYTALEYPSSWAVPSQIMYGNADGAVWSPALPKPGEVVNRIRESIMSPGKRSSFGRGGSGSIIRKDFTAPTPNDPFAAFPSFTAAMEVDSTITYPSRVVLG
jgi:hypothetical protein